METILLQAPYASRRPRSSTRLRAEDGRNGRRVVGLALLWVIIMAVLKALIVPLSVVGLGTLLRWQILASRAPRVAWGAA